MGPNKIHQHHDSSLVDKLVQKTYSNRKAWMVAINGLSGTTHQLVMGTQVTRLKHDLTQLWNWWVGDKCKWVVCTA